jgi:hypothetical protein
MNKGSKNTQIHDIVSFQTLSAMLCSILLDLSETSTSSQSLRTLKRLEGYKEKYRWKPTEWSLALRMKFGMTQFHDQRIEARSLHTQLGVSH